VRTLKKNILTMIWFRLIVIATLLVAAVIIQLSTSVFLPLMPFYLFVLFSFLLSVVYLLLYHWDRHYTFQAYFQILIDLLLISYFVYISGGLNGNLYFLYIFSIIAASLVLSKRAAYLIASLAAILFGVLADGMYLGIIAYFRQGQFREVSLGLVLYTIFMAWALFFVIAVLVNYLAGSLRKAREQLVQTQKELDRRERLATAGRVSAMIAHEIRNPLTAIAGAVQVLKNELSPNEEQSNLMDIVLRESRRVSQAIEQFLNLASPAKAAFSRFSVPQVLKETLMMLKMSGELNGRVAIQGNFDTLDLDYYGNPSEFKQVFWNLARNALQAMPDGGTLAVDFFQDKRELRMRFSDTGRGMTPEEQEHIFEPFYSRFENGKGLGLAVVQKIIDDYQGKIRVSSTPQQGTEFVIFLPAQASPKKEME
jgi:two-component system, NtrC family, sensor histidine kinase HydH